MWRKHRYSYHLLYKGGLLDVDQGFMLSVAKDADDVVELWDALKDRHLTALSEVDVEVRILLLNSAVIDLHSLLSI